MKYLLPALILALPLQRAAAQQTEGGASYAHMTAQDLNREAAELEAAALRGSSDIELYIRLGFIYTRLEKADEAQRAFENAARLDPRKAVVQYMLGLIYEKKGLTDKAIEAWKACLDNASEERMRDTARRHLHHLRRS